MNTKRPPKIKKSLRLNWSSCEILTKIVQQTGMSEGQVTEWAIAEFFTQHPEYWPKEKAAAD